MKKYIIYLLVLLAFSTTSCHFPRRPGKSGKHLAESRTCFPCYAIGAPASQWRHLQLFGVLLAQASAPPRLRQPVHRPGCGEFHPSAARAEHHALEPSAGPRAGLCAAPGAAGARGVRRGGGGQRVPRAGCIPRMVAQPVPNSAAAMVRLTATRMKRSST